MARKSIIKNNSFERVLTSLSNLPTFVLGCLEFMAILVSFPLYATIPVIFPDAKTVFAHNVFSNFKDCLKTSPLYSSLNNPVNS